MKILLTLTLALLTVAALADDIVIYPTHVAVTNTCGKHPTGCPLPDGYCGYFNYVKTNGLWGFAPDTNSTTHCVTDTNQLGTIVQVVGSFGDVYCDSNEGVCTANPAPSTVYRFTVYFYSSNSIPTTTNYPLVLHGFLP